jgi:hypothetical protein
MSTPIPGLTIQISTTQELIFFDIDTREVKKISSIKEVSNYEYEVAENEKKRKILLLRKEYLPAFIEDFRKAMRYDKNSQYINNKNKRTSNPNISNI